MSWLYQQNYNRFLQIWKQCLTLCKEAYVNQKKTKECLEIIFISHKILASQGVFTDNLATVKTSYSDSFCKNAWFCVVLTWRNTSAFSSSHYVAHVTWLTWLGLRDWITKTTWPDLVVKTYWYSLSWCDSWCYCYVKRIRIYKRGQQWNRFSMKSHLCIL